MDRMIRSALGLALLCVVGCGDGLANVSGTVSLNEKAVVEGSITFVKTEGGLVREGATIRDGSFQARMPPGTYKVELSAQKVTGSRKQKGFDGTEEVIELREEMFPERYNAKTELSETVKPGGNALKFDLKSP